MTSRIFWKVLTLSWSSKTSFLPFSAIFALPASSSAAILAMASAQPSAMASQVDSSFKSPASKQKPVSPSTTTSGHPMMRLAMHGVSMASASSKTFGKPSRKDGIATTLQRSKTKKGSFVNSCTETCSSSFKVSIICMISPLSSPSPTIKMWMFGTFPESMHFLAAFRRTFWPFTGTKRPMLPTTNLPSGIGYLFFASTAISGVRLNRAVSVPL
mmetsp:Transcript_73127/g.117921  ORF Transcript_73127/g.117921 Transcript_73127/m.117921 type:complete len:214 (+) Transcript_73127:381-1022(+)